MKVKTVTGPAAFASALVNGDQSSLTTEDVIALDKWRHYYLAPGDSVVSTTEDEPSFSWLYWLYDERSRGGDLIDYVVLNPNEEEEKAEC